MHNTNQNILSNKKQLIALVSILSLIIAVTGYFFYKSQESNIRQKQYHELKAIADLKENQIIEWIKQRNAEVRVITQSVFFKKGLLELQRNTSDARLKKEIIERLKPFCEKFGYEDISLSMPDGHLLLSVKEDLIELDRYTKQKISEVSDKKVITFTDFYICQLEKKIHYDIIVPIFDGRSKTVLTMLFRRDPNDFLYPLIQKWPTPSYSAETAIVRLEKDSIVFLNELRHRKNSALSFKIPLTHTQVPEVKGALGATGLFEGPDYRGVEVLSDIRMIPATKWILISKVDKSEIFSNLYIMAGVVAGFSLFLILICGIGFAFIYSTRQRIIYKELYIKEKELWQIQEKFKVTVDSLGEGVITADIKGNIQYINKMAEELTGWSFRDAQGRQLKEIYSVKNEKTGKKENNIIEKVLKHGVVKELGNHTLLISKTGKEIPVMDTGAPIYNNENSMIGLVLTFYDETEKRRNHYLLEENEKRFRTTLDNMIEGCQIIGNDWRYIYVNNTATIHNRRPKEELLGNKYMDVWPGIEQTEVFRKIKRCLLEKIDHTMENEFVYPDGVKGWFELKIQSVPDGVFILSYDISKKKLAEEEYKKLSKVIVQSPISVIITDPTGKIEYANPKFSAITGYSSEEILGKNINLLNSGTHSDEFYEGKWNTILEGKEWKAEVQNKKKNGELYWENVSISPIVNETGGITNFVEIREDINERIEMMNDLITAKEKAEELNKVKSHFFANMSHELRTPFVGIMGYAELLSESLVDPEYKEMAEGILNTSKRMKDTLTKILSLSKLEFNGIEKVIKKIDPEQIIENVYRQFIKTAEQKKLSFRKRINFEPFLMETDETLLSEILNNLVSNAIIYTNEGWLEISAEKQLRNNEDLLIIKVIDTGIGIPKMKQELIWEEFRQVSEGTTRSYQGTGLGLAIVKKYTGLLGGKISLESDSGAGSTFILELPILKVISSDNQPEEQTVDINRHTDSVKKKILHVEDDQIAIDVIKRALCSHYEMDFAENAKLALEKIEEKNFDVILMDINLGCGINGEELTQKIRTMPGCEEIPIIAVTAYASDSDKKEFLGKGMSHYIAKPFLMQDLLKLLDEVLSTK